MKRRKEKKWKEKKIQSSISLSTPTSCRSLSPSLQAAASSAATIASTAERSAAEGASRAAAAAEEEQREEGFVFVIFLLELRASSLLKAETASETARETAGL